MHKRYELWLDESGSFENEASDMLLPSLIGGVLLPCNAINDRVLDRLIPLENGHACEIRGRKGKVILPVLKQVIDMGGHFVYFENTERVSHLGQRQLYLKMMATGLVKLLRLLAAENDTFDLNVYIALRVDVQAQKKLGENMIPEEDYLADLKLYITDAMNQQAFWLNSSSKLNIALGSARKDRKLMIADYACNSRLTRGCKQFNETEKSQLEAIYEEKYLFSLNELLSESQIKVMLSQSDIAGALTEFYTTREKVSRKKILNLIITKLQNLNYRVCKVQLSNFLSNIKKIVEMENDFEHGEEILKKILKEFVPVCAEKQVYADEFEFDICLYLCDMYLREGDIIHAEPMIERGKSVAGRLSEKFEYILRQYQMIEKDALYEINCFNYQSAVDKLRNVISCIENIMLLLGDEPLIKSTLTEMKSEYLGDAYCMQLYAQMFLQRENPELYDTMCRDSDTALMQYSFPGELERNQQYRAHIEMEEGNIKGAIEWLFRTVDMDTEKSLSEQCDFYLDKALNENLLSRHYYVMYYLEIAAEAILRMDQDTAKTLFQAFRKKKDLWDLYCGFIPNSIEFTTEQGMPLSIQANVLKNVIGDRKVPNYHPVEIIAWKIGTYYANTGDIKNADIWYARAVQICGGNMDYLVLIIISLGIQCERLYYHIESNPDDLEREINQLRKTLQRILKEQMPTSTVGFLKQFEELLFLDKDNIKEKKEKLWSFSRKIAF